MTRGYNVSGNTQAISEWSQTGKKQVEHKHAKYIEHRYVDIIQTTCLSTGFGSSANDQHNLCHFISCFRQENQ